MNSIIIKIKKMNPKKLCSIGILGIQLNLILTKSQSEKYNFNINDYNTVSDLKNIFYPNEEFNTNNEIDYFDYVNLTSENNLINTLLHINRAYKSKTFIEFIMPNKLDYGEGKKFIHNLLTEICSRNYLFIIENKLIDTPSNIKFNINIIDDETKEIAQYKTFDLFEMNDIELSLNAFNEDLKFDIDNKIFNLDYNFDKVDYFLIDLFSFKEILYKNKYNMEKFIYKVINSNKKIMIILIINEKCFTEYDFTSLIEKYKEIIELSDIIFCDKDEMNYFFKTYNELKNNGIEYTITSNINNNDLTTNNKDSKIKRIPYNLINNNTENDYDLIIFDNDKHRKNIKRTTILFSDFKSITIYEQIGTYMEVDLKESFYFKFGSEKQDLYYKKNIQFYYTFIGGFLSRLTHDKSYRVCFYAGLLLLEKIYKNKIKKKYLFNVDDYNVLVPKEKKSIRERMFLEKEKEIEEKKNKEKGFILDCTNLNDCKIKIYNPLLDNNCAGYLLKKNIFEHLKQHGFINKNGTVLKDPDKYGKKRANTIKTKKKMKLNLFGNYNDMKLPLIQNNEQNKKRNIFDLIENKDQHKFPKTINNFYRIKKIKIKNIIINNDNKFMNPIPKNNNIIKTDLNTEYNNNENSKLLAKTTKNFLLKNKYKIENNSNKKIDKNIILKNLKMVETKNKLNFAKNKNNPKYNIYSKYLYKLYAPKIKYNEYIETKNNDKKKSSLKRVNSQL